MAKRKRWFKVSDTVTYERSWLVSAVDEDDALDITAAGIPDNGSFEEEMTDDCSAYDVEPATQEDIRERLTRKLG